jgi:glycosyltransferase involved in cell wall biosynthesis
VARDLRVVTGRHEGVHVSPWGIDHADCDRANFAFSPTEAPQPIERYLLYVGQARSHKGFGALLGGYRRSGAAQAGVRLVCVGSDFAAGAGGASLLACLGDAGVAKGVVDDAALHDLYSRADALVHLAEHEGFGFTPLEALAAGTRVIASDIPVLRETLGQHAAFVECADPDAVAESIDRVLAGPASAPTERASRMRWVQRYRWDRHARDVLAAYAAAAQ